MKSGLSSASIEENFQTLKKIETFLSRRVNGYVHGTELFDSYNQYTDHHENLFPVKEKVRVSDAIKMHKAIVAFEREHGVRADLDLSYTSSWQDQLKGKALLASNNIDMELYSDIKDGQLMIHNRLGNAYTLVEFQFVFDKEGKYGHIQLSKEGREMFPKLESALRGKMLVNGGHQISVNNENFTDHLQVDTDWLISELSNLTTSNDIIREIAASTGPMRAEIGDRDRKNNRDDYSENSLGMM